jgi:acyl-CoA synthetase (AMP-forming)/AMP-acid ligase II
MEITLGSSFARSARKYPLKVAVMDEQRRITYRELNERVNRLAHGLADLGLRKGDYAATLSNNCTFLMEVYLAHLELGVTTIPLTARETRENIIRQVKLIRPSFLLFHVDFTEVAKEILKKVPCVNQPVAFGGEVPQFAQDAELLIQQANPVEPEEVVREEDEAFIMFTGGTTGDHKGAILTHKSLLWNIICKTTENQFPTQEDVIYYPMQMYHAAALSRFLAFMYAGGTFIGSAVFDPERYLAMVEQERTTCIVGNSTIWRMLLEVQRAHAYDSTSIKRWLHSQGPLEPDLRKEVEGLLFPNGEGYVSYALTEASPGVTLLKPRDTPCHWSSVGRPYMCTEVRIGDPADDSLLEPGEVGEIQVRGPTVMKGYFGDRQATEEVLRGGWLHTGDLGKFDERGYLYVVDRLKDMIKSGGINIYSREVEEVLCAHPQLEEAAVIGVPHDKWGESLRAIVVPQRGSGLTAEMLMAHCNRYLAGYKKPTSVIFVDSLPKGTFGGKVLKRELRKRYGNPD